MKNTEAKIIEWFLRLSLSAGLLSAVADRFGLWPKKNSAWGDWDNFVSYTATLNPLFPSSAIPFLAIVATLLELVFGLGLLIPFKTKLVARATGTLLLIFAISMAFSIGVKAPLDYSVFCGSAAAFALSIIIKKK